ncbi:MAG TPA: nitrogenase component 1 [Negativicutes bacterium]
MCKSQWDNVCTQVNTCALTGAAAFFAGIPDAVMIVNGPLWCYFYALRHLEKSCTTVGTRFYCSQPDNNAVVYGTEDCLVDLLQFIRENSRPSVLLIENSCAIGLIGDDIAGIASQVKLPCPVICIDSGGLTGGYWEGYRAAAKAYLAMMPLLKRSIVQPRTVNLLGCTIGYYNAANDIRELKRMLALAGYQVLACPGAGSSTAEIAAMTQAELNIVVHEELGLDLAHRLHQDYGMPYLSLLPPYGLEGSLTWLKTIGQKLSIDKQSLQFVQHEVDNLERQLRAATLEMLRIWGELCFESTLIAAPSSVALGMVPAVCCEWVDTGPLTTVVHDGIPAYPLPNGIDMVLDGSSDNAAIEHQLAGLAGGLLLASSNEKAILHQQAVEDVVWQNIALPVYDEVLLTDRPFMGLRGAGHMTERLWNQYIACCQRWK